MTDNDARDMQALEALLKDASQEKPAVPSDLMARILADAAAVQQAALAKQVDGPPVPRVTVWQGVWSALGGWVGAGGLTAAATVGLWIGFAPPAALDSVLATFWGDSVTVSLFSPDDLFGLEG